MFVQYWYWLAGVSLFCFVLERLFPWRKQAALRPQVGQDLFWLVFNGHILGIALAKATAGLILWINARFGALDLTAPEALMWIHDRPVWVQFAIFRVLKSPWTSMQAATPASLSSRVIRCGRGPKTSRWSVNEVQSKRLASWTDSGGKHCGSCARTPIDQKTDR